MSGGQFCRCKPDRRGGRNKPSMNWVVVDRYCNHSAFNGYRATSSDYSAIRCLDCGAGWRTKAQYVSQLRSATEEEIMRPMGLSDHE